ncbi:hypothetical protein ACQP2T_63770 (plasmid) [Nonomuraea sp. CA-143628]|uniref:hypothetical protein n=1 Tax=Nonomuraea sp. CA-143628 TaxID=3239997 RepID=UPI003D8AC545
MTHADDLYEPGDDRDWTLDELAEREPGEPDQEPPLNLDQIEGALAAYRRGQDPREGLDPVEASDADQAESFLLDEAVPQLLARLREALQRIAEWEALPTREEWTVTDDSSTPPTSNHFPYTANAAMAIAARDGRQAWRRTVMTHPAVLHPWEPIANEAPF